MPGGPHLDDGALLRWLDGEAEPTAAGHVPAACATCAARAGVLGRRTAALRALLQATDEPAPAPPDVALVLQRAAARAAAHAAVARPPAAPPTLARRPAWRARPALRLAAAGVALAAASLAAQPVRHWAAAQWARLTGARPAAAPRAARRRPGAPADTGPTAHAARPAVVVRFTPALAPGQPFTVRFDARPARGTLHVAPNDGPGASAALLAAPGAAGPKDLLVLPDGVRVRNRPGSAGDYRVQVPAGVTRVRLTFARPARDTVLAVPPDGVAVPLGRPASGP